MANDMDEIGAAAAGAAFRELRSQIPLPDSIIGRGLVDWVDAEPVLRMQARQLDEGVADISTDLWTYMQRNREYLPDIPLATSAGWVQRLRSLYSARVA